MYLSTLLIDVGDNPDRPRPGRLWLRNLYRVHQRLCMAFPSERRKQQDPEMIQPYSQEDFADGQVHVRRDDTAGFLFRVDPQPGGRVVIVVLSALKPDWNYAFGLNEKPHNHLTNRPAGNAGYLLASPPAEPRFFNLVIENGRKFRFHLLANPTQKRDTLPKEKRLEKAVGRHGRRVPVPNNELTAWLQKRADRAGFHLIEVTSVQPGCVFINKTRSAAEGQRLRSARYQGILEVTDACQFAKAVAAGIGPGKAFGFGLLSVAPA